MICIIVFDVTAAWLRQSWVGVLDPRSDVGEWIGQVNRNEYHCFFADGADEGILALEGGLSCAPV